MCEADPAPGIEARKVATLPLALLKQEMCQPLIDAPLRQGSGGKSGFIA
ncbi:MAG TPA: hypothetical protein PKA59_09020 [Chakrabartia sp.]|nr:hypothetical protein [Chakrabartia sp.]